MKARKINIGDKYGSYEVISEPYYDGIYRKVKCKCKCGKIREIYCCNIIRLTKCKLCYGKDISTFKIGDRNNNVVILEILPYSKIKIRCDCGTIKIIDNGYFRELKSCGCIIKIKGEGHPSYKGYKDISGTLFTQIKYNAEKRNFEFTISIKKLQKILDKQNGRCALSGMDIRNSNKSLDRIDSSKGYHEKNIQWIHKDINRMKSDFDEKYFIDLCKLIAIKNK